MTAVERRWLRHPETGGYFYAPVAAVPDWLSLGWVPSDPPPPEPSPVVAERIRWEHERQAAAQPAAPSKPTRRSAAEPKE